MTEPTREQLIERMADAIERVAKDKANNAIVPIEVDFESFKMTGVCGQPDSFAQVAYGAVQENRDPLAPTYEELYELRDQLEGQLRRAEGECCGLKDQMTALEERIRQVREIAAGIECGNCDHPTALHAPICTHMFRGLQCMCDWKSLGHGILAVLDGEGEKADVASFGPAHGGMDASLQDKIGSDTQVGGAS